MTRDSSHGSVRRDTVAYTVIHQAWSVKRPGTMTGALQGQPVVHLKRANATRRKRPSSQGGRRLDRDRINSGQIEGSQRRSRITRARLSRRDWREQMTRLRVRPYLAGIVRKCQRKFYSGMIGRIEVFGCCDLSIRIVPSCRLLCRLRSEVEKSVVSESKREGKPMSRPRDGQVWMQRFQTMARIVPRDFFTRRCS